MRDGYGSCSVCLCVCYRASCYIPRLYIESRVPLGFLCCSQHMYCVDFVEDALFKSSSEICWSTLPSSLHNKLSMDKRDSDDFFSWRLACRTNDRSYNSTDSSLVTVDYQQCFLAFKTTDQARAWSCCIFIRNRVQLHIHILVVTLDV